jgi:tetratricopeptide (TPR) repeat protein
MGEEKFKEGVYQQAVVILDLVLEKNRKDYRAWIIKGYAHIERSELSQARDCFNSAADIAPADYYRSLAWLLMARVSQATNEIDQAIIQAQKAVCSQLTEANYLISLLYIEKDLVKDGLAQLQLAIEEDREYLVAACYESNLSKIEAELNFFVDNMIQQYMKNIGYQLEEIRVALQEVENLGAKTYNHLDLKNAHLKYRMAEKKYETHSYFGYVDAHRLANEAVAYSKIVKSSTVKRKKLALSELKEYVQLSLRSGKYYGLFAAGWGLVAGGGIGIAMVLKYGPEYNYRVVSYAIIGTIIGFLWGYVLNLRITSYKKRFFLKRFTKRFRRLRGGQRYKQPKP